MNTKLSEIARQKPYPGRFLILGRTAGKYIAVYGVTARSTTYPLKRYVFNSQTNSIHVQPLDMKKWENADTEFLDYTAVHFFKEGIVIGNGRQTDCIEQLNRESAKEQLIQDLQNEKYETDKYSTPRITGCFLNRDEKWSAALYIIRSNSLGDSVRDCYDLDLSEDTAYFISTYEGPNVRPTPSFVGSPIQVRLAGENIEEIAKNIYNTFGPQAGGEDLRVSVVAIELEDKGRDSQIHIVNTVDV